MEKQQFSVGDSSGETSETKKSECTEEKFVWPWVGLVANIQTEVDKTGRRVGRSGSTFRDELIEKGFDPTRVQPIWNFKGHSGFALVEFTRDIKGFENAMNFERSYKSDGHGKKDWEKGVHLRDDKPYGWVCREEDYNRGGIVGKNVKKKRDLKTLSQLQEEEERKMVQLVENMSQSIEMKIISKQELEHKVDETSRVLESVELHNYQLNETYKQEVEKMHANLQGLYQQILVGHDKSMSDLETEREKLENRARQIYINEAEIEKSRLEIEMNQKAMMEQNEANMEAMKLAEKHQASTSLKEKEKLHEKIMEMEAKLNETQELELEIEKLKGSTNVMKHMALLFGSSACVLPTIYGLGLVYGGDPFNSGLVYSSSSSVPLLSKLNGILLTVLGPAFGYPIASSAVRVLKGLWRNDLTALKGDCPNCGEEVFAFVRSDQSNKSAHKAECHVCECTLEFRTKVEKSASLLGRKWVYGRIYLVSRPRRGRRSKYT
ncbi:hypothetical protein F2Q70_00005510 [Brassica cretica]|uniref:XS domain-containing protein n=1 Tax=Brassica cretica TaxID=69181 RepID=A0A8S9ILH1_BRACR|nr:hypothetical protein F2Q70_00005510 [Brassica cretica]